jgi:hypothetical protein
MPFAFVVREMPLGFTVDAHVCLGVSMALQIERPLRSIVCSARRLSIGGCAILAWHGFASGVICSALVSMVKANAQARRTPVLPPQG